MSKMKLIMENFRNFEKIVEEEESTLPRYRDKEGNEWLDKGRILTLCSTRSCRMMPKTPENLAKLECISNCPENKAEPLKEQFGNEAGTGTMPDLRFDQMYALTKRLMNKKEFNIQALALLGNIPENPKIPGHLGIEIPSKTKLIHRFEPGTSVRVLQRAVEFITANSEISGTYVPYLKKHNIEIQAGFTLDSKNPSVFINAEKGIQPNPTMDVAPGLPPAR